jgi:hypothetical protein
MWDTSVIFKYVTAYNSLNLVTLLATQTRPYFQINFQQKANLVLSALNGICFCAFENTKSKGFFPMGKFAMGDTQKM